MKGFKSFLKMFTTSLTAIALLSGVFTPALSETPLMGIDNKLEILGPSEEYMRYLDDPESFGDYVPAYNFPVQQEPTMLEPEISPSYGAVDVSTLPARYSSLDYYYTPAKNQGSDGTCVVYSTTGGMEIFLRKNTGVLYDLSENHTKYSLSNSAYYDKTNFFGYNRAPGDGTSFGHIASYLFNGLGPVLESQSPYVWGNDQVSASSIESIDPAYRFTQVYHLPNGRDLTSWINDMKAYIYEYGAVAIAIDYQGDYFDRSGKYMYDYRSSRGVNHAVLLVGWDDNMPASNFANASNGATPSSNGGFIVRNSWGDGYGDAGNFYISYENCTLWQTDSLVLADYTINNPNQTVNTYSEYGVTTYVGYGTDSPTWYGNRFYLGANEYVSLDEVGFYAAGDNLKYEVYLNANGSINLADMTMIASGTTERAGYYTVPVSSPITLGSSAESSYTIAIRVFSNSSMFPIPIEAATGETASYASTYISYTTGGDRVIAPNVSTVTDSLNAAGISYSTVPTGLLGVDGFGSFQETSDYNIVVTSVTSPADAAAVHNIPGSFSAADASSLTGGMNNSGDYISATANDSTASYDVNVASAGSYALSISMVAGDYSADRTVSVYAGSNLLGTFKVENTDNGTNFLIHKLFVNIPNAGMQTLRVVASGGVNIKSLTFEAAAPVVSSVPANISALDYSNQSGVVINNGSVEYLNEGDTISYTIDVVNAGDYIFTLNGASAVDGSNAKLTVLKNNLAYNEASFTLGNSGGWENYADSQSVTVNLTSGKQELRFTVGTGFNLKSINITAVHRTAGEISAFNVIEAEYLDSKNGMVVEGYGQSNGNLGGVQNGNYAVYENVNFGGKGAVSAQFNASVISDGGYIEVRIDSVDGKLLGTCNLTSTGNWETWNTFTCDIDSSVTGVHNVYLIFRNPSYYVCNLDWFKFEAKQVSAYDKIEAEWTDDYSHSIKVEAYGENGGSNVGNTKNGLFTAYRNVDFGTAGASSVTLRVSAATTATGTIEIRKGSRNGALLGSCKTTTTGGWGNWTDVTCDIITTTGVNDIYLVYVPDSSMEYVANIEWFRFNSLLPVEISAINIDGDVISCQTENGIGTVKYWFYVLKDGEILFSSGSYSTSNSINYSAPAGSRIRVYCLDDSGTKVAMTTNV